MYKIMIRVFNNKTNKWNWKPSRCTDGRVYEYETKEEAEKMVYICYGRDTEDVKIVNL